MSLFKNLFMILVAVLLVAGVSGMYGCKKEGPAERAGKKIDEALEGAKEKVDEATKK